MKKADINDRSINLETFNQMVEAVGQVMTTDDSITKGPAGFGTSQDAAVDSGWSVSIVGQNRIRIVVGSMIVGDGYDVQFDIDHSVGFITSIYDCCQATPYNKDSYQGCRSIVYTIPASKYATDDAIPLSMSPEVTGVDGGFRKLYVVAAAVNYDTTLGRVNPVGSPNRGIVFVTNRLALAGQAPRYDNDDIDTQAWSKYAKAIAEIWIYSDGHVARVEQLVHGDIKLLSTVDDSRRQSKFVTTVDLTAKIPLFGEVHATGASRKTIETADRDNANCGVQQLQAVDLMPEDSMGVPVFASTPGYCDCCGVSGELQWASIDACYKACVYPDVTDTHYQRTIETRCIAEDHLRVGPERVLQLHCVDQSPQKVWSIGAYKHYGNAGAGELQWLQLDSDLGGHALSDANAPLPKSTAVNAAVPMSLEWGYACDTCKPYQSLYDFTHAGGAYSCSGSDKLLVRAVECGVPTLRYVNVCDVGHVTPVTHYCLSAGAGICIGGGYYDPVGAAKTICTDWSAMPVCTLPHTMLRGGLGCYCADGSGWTLWDDHGGRRRQDGRSDIDVGLYPYMLIGSRCGCITKSYMYCRNSLAAPNYLGSCLYVQNKIFGESCEEATIGCRTTGGLQLLGGASITKKLQASALAIHGSGACIGATDATLQPATADMGTLALGAAGCKYAQVNSRTVARNDYTECVHNEAVVGERESCIANYFTHPITSHTGVLCTCGYDELVVSARCIHHSSLCSHSIQSSALSLTTDCMLSSDIDGTNCGHGLTGCYGPNVLRYVNGIMVENVSCVTPVTDGTYTVGIGEAQNGTITIASGIITAVQEAIA